MRLRVSKSLFLTGGGGFVFQNSKWTEGNQFVNFIRLLVTQMLSSDPHFAMLWFAVPKKNGANHLYCHNI